MKKILGTTLVLVSMVTSAFASDATEIDRRIMNEFKSNYINAVNVSYTLKSNFTKVDFELNSKKVSAFYSPSREFIGTSQNISLEELPVNAKRRFAKAYQGYTVKEALKFESPDETAYFISAENENGSKIIKCTASGYISSYGWIQK
jgi:hypothetical protein